MESHRREFISLIVVLTMLADHVGRLFLPEIPALRAVGRLCFPLVAALLADGMLRTRDPKRYALRLFALALVSQIPFQFAFATAWVNPFLGPALYLRMPDLMAHASWAPLLPEVNVLFLLALAVPAVACLQWHRWIALAAICVAAFLLPIEYGLYGLLVVLLSYLYFTQAVGTGMYVLAMGVLSAGVAYLSGSHVQTFAVLAVLFVVPGGIRLDPGFRLPRVFYYAFYPAHLLLLGALAASS